MPMVEQAMLKRAQEWIEQALQAFEGGPDPSEIEGKNIAAELAAFQYESRVFTLDEWIADPWSPHKGNREATKAMLDRLRIPYRP